MSSHLEQALSTLTQTPFDKLRDDEKEYILKLKRDLPFDDELAQHLAELGLSALLPYLVWIPFSMFIGGIRKLGQGGFATVYKGTLRYTDGDSGKVVKQDFALKEVDVSMLQEIVMSVIMNIKGNIWRCFARTLGLTSRPESGKFLLVMEYAAGAYQSIINDCWNIDPSKRPTAAEVSRHLYVYRASLKIYSRGWLPGTTPLRIFYHKYIRHPPSPETKAYVSRRVTEHHRNLKAEQNGDSDTFTFVSGMSSASSLAHRSQYYTRSQLAEFSQSLTSAALKKVPESPLTADSAKTS
ncbi:hypothetical protein BC936DRAFT_142059 [Jimgerdemannia flammicorona]|uniref:Uncharacterized protein n=2 Tax=Jimgerdemannia flammicorona TaxID=994334 RepID=A0A433DFH9_9FUNG|nr:hypothetical protein BC936DRAFT_142059 [Jimgerdemannia flammicorona]RUS28884.1 hypothetical protein BC938DRAFT_481321 [Jimgerdemannia flammicorona]